MKLSARFFLVIAVIASSMIFATAQPGGGGPPGGGGGGGKGPPCQSPPCGPPVPITGIEYLIGAGALFGIRYFRNRKK